MPFSFSKKFWRWIFGLGLFIGFSIWIQYQFGWKQILIAWKDLNSWELLVAINLMILSYLFRSLRYCQERNSHIDAPKFWELSLCWYVFLIIVGVMAVVTGIRAFWEQPFPWLAGLIAPGYFVIFFFWRRLIRFHRRVFDAYHF